MTGMHNAMFSIPVSLQQKSLSRALSWPSSQDLASYGVIFYIDTELNDKMTTPGLETCRFFKKCLHILEIKMISVENFQWLCHLFSLDKGPSCEATI